MNLDMLIHDPGVQAAGAVVLGIFVLFITGEMAWSYYRSHHFHTISSFIINITIALFQQLSDVFNKIVFILGYVFVQEHFSVQVQWHWPEIPVGTPLSFSAGFPFIHIQPEHLFIWLGILLLADLCQYWLHRLSHEVNILWAGHIVHHSMESYNFSVALRQSFIESLYTWVFYLPLAFLGIPWPLFIMAYSISLVWQFLVHTRYIDKLGWLEGFMSTPSHHRVHHGKNERYIDKNYGALFIFWDKLFGTFEPETEPVEYGVKSAISSHNPIWANIHHHVRIVNFIKHAKNWRERLSVIFGPPAFELPDMPEVVKREKPAEHGGLAGLKKMYILLNFMGIAAFSVQQLIAFDNTKAFIPFMAAAILIIFSHIINIAMLENRKWADHAEVSRLVLIFASGMLLYTVWDWKTGVYLAFLAMILMGLTFWIAHDYKQRQVSGLKTH